MFFIFILETARIQHINFETLRESKEFPEMKMCQQQSCSVESELVWFKGGAWFIELKITRFSVFFFWRNYAGTDLHRTWAMYFYIFREYYVNFWKIYVSVLLSHAQSCEAPRWWSFQAANMMEQTQDYHSLPTKKYWCKCSLQHYKK